MIKNLNQALSFLCENIEAFKPVAKHITMLEHENEELKQKVKDQQEIIEEQKERILMTEEAIFEIAEIQSYEYENRVMLEEALFELAEIIGGNE